jgi:hypothetical protein
MTLPPKDLRLVVEAETRHESIRFSNRILNRGPGDLEMAGLLNADTNIVSVTQIIHGTNLSIREQDTGVFYYHDSHSHWHWEGFSDYKIWSITSSGGLQATMASSAKVGYCLEDVEIFSGNQTIIHAQDDQPLPEVPQFNSCYWRRQGLSVGWMDVYRSHIPGQSIDITHLPDGVYALQSTVDPANLILEVNDANNTSLVYFSLQDNRLGVLPKPPTPSSLRKLSE